jgi:hypothetical protein
MKSFLTQLICLDPLANCFTLIGKYAAAKMVPVITKIARQKHMEQSASIRDANDV